MTKIKLTIAIILIAVLTVVAAKIFSQSNSTSNTDAARIKGPKNAPLQVVEYIDFQCPACANASFYMKEVMEQYPKLVRLEVRHFPLSMHKHAVTAAYYAQCAAAQNKFWPMHDELFKHQAKWSKLPEAHSVFDLIAKEINLNMDKLNACLQDESVVSAVNDQKEKAKLKGIQSTPTYFINDQMFVGPKSLKMHMEGVLMSAGSE